METKRHRKSTSWMDDGDDAHFSDNPAVPESTRKRWQAEERKQFAASEKRHPAVKMTKKKVHANTSSFDRVYRRPKSGTKRMQRKRVSVK